MPPELPPGIDPAYVGDLRKRLLAWLEADLRAHPIPELAQQAAIMTLCANLLGQCIGITSPSLQAVMRALAMCGDQINKTAIETWHKHGEGPQPPGEKPN